MAALKRIVRYFTPYRGLLAITVLTGLAGAVASLLPPMFTKWIIDDAMIRGDRQFLLLMVLGLVLAPIAAGLLTVAQGWLTTVAVQRVMFDLRNQLFAHLLELPVRFYTKTRSGEIISRATNDINGIQAVLANNFTNVTTNVITIVTTAALMFYLDWGLTLLSLAALPLFVLPTIKAAGVRVAAGRRVQSALGELTGVLSDKLNINGLIMVKTFAQQPRERDDFAAKGRVVRDSQIAQSMVARWFFMFTGLFASIIPALILGYGGWRVIDGALSIGAVVAFVLLATRLFMPVSQLLNFQVDLAGSVALFERIFEYLDLPKEIEDKPNALALPATRGEVALEHATFEYELGKPVLHDLSISASPGQMVAIVGPSGSGKTSIAYLLMRLYDPTAGRVVIDGHDLRDVSLASLGRHIGIVTQETFLFHTTVAENMRYAKPDATDEELVAACKAAQIHDVIEAMPGKYQTMVGERGYRLSGGEKQRLAIARLILKNPKVLVLDEATSSLDTHSERLVQQALESLMTGRTSFVIAHRLSTILAADKILVIDQGRLLEQGTHAELLARGGLYAKLYEEQFRDEGAKSDGAEPVSAEAPGGQDFRH
jgi:ATP-binding cassette subfamily B protein